MATLVSNSLAHSSLVDLTDVTLAFEYTKSKLVDVVTVNVADVDATECVDDSLEEILKLNLCQYNICIEGEADISRPRCSRVKFFN